MGEYITAERLRALLEGWHEDTGAIEWGLLVPRERAVEVDRVETPDVPHDYTCDYALKEVPRG